MGFRGIAGSSRFTERARARARESERGSESERARDRAREQESERERERGTKTRRQVNELALFDISKRAINTYIINNQYVSLADAKAKR